MFKQFKDRLKKKILWYYFGWMYPEVKDWPRNLIKYFFNLEELYEWNPITITYIQKNEKDWDILFNNVRHEELSNLLSNPNTEKYQFDCEFNRIVGFNQQIVNGNFIDEIELCKEQNKTHFSVNYLSQMLTETLFINITYDFGKIDCPADGCYRLYTNIKRMNGLYILPAMRLFPNTPEGFEKAKQTFLAYLKIYHCSDETDFT